jgi:hypothetical protein
MNKKHTENLRANLEDRVKGNIQLEAYKSDTFELSDWTLTSVLDDILMVQYVDVSETGREVLRNGIYVSVDVSTHVWRVGKVILAGPNCRFTKEGDHVVFPNDKGIRASNINGIKNIVFLNEARIFGVCTLKDQ